jgi:hypothetical protein
MFVPSGHIDFVVRVLLQLIQLQQKAVTDGKRTGVINVVSVDNASQVGKKLQTAYSQVVRGEQLIVLQDLWHAQERYLRELITWHPLTRTARTEGKQLTTALLTGRYSTPEQLREQWLAWGKKYRQPVSHAAVGAMADVVQMARMLRTDSDPAVMSVEEVIANYNRNSSTRRLPVDHSGDVNEAPLRLSGLKALQNLVSADNIAYVWNRWAVPACRRATGTTKNESLHHTLNGRMSVFGGMRTYTTAQQYAMLVQYQMNHRRLNPGSNRWQIPIRYLPLNATRMPYLPPLPLETDELLLMLSKFELSLRRIDWTTEQDDALLHNVRNLASGKEYCHTQDVFYWLGGHPALIGKTPAQIKSRFYKLRRMRLSEQAAVPEEKEEVSTTV